MDSAFRIKGLVTQKQRVWIQNDLYHCVTQFWNLEKKNRWTEIFKINNVKTLTKKVPKTCPNLN